jgi:CBS domain-containing protein
MQVREAMSQVVVMVGPDHTLRDAARRMSERRVGAAVVVDDQGSGPGIITERDILNSAGRDESLDEERVGAHLTSEVVYAAPDWSLEHAAAEMVRGSFRHIIVLDPGSGEVCGIISMRDIVRCWTEDGAACDLGPATPA